MTTISIVTPSYNQGRYISEALESVRLQKHPGVEHLVLDGGSTDDTVEQLRRLDGDAAWAHVCWQSGPDGGQSDALNRGFTMASGHIVGWLNSDDRYRAGCFDYVVKAFEDHPEVDIFYGDFTLMDQGSTIRKIRREIDFNRFILMYHQVLYIATTATFFRRRVFEEGNLLLSDLHYAMDYEFFLRLTAKGYRIKRIPQVLADFRFHSESKSSRMVRVQLAEKRSIMQSFSPVNHYLKSRGLRRAACLGLQVAAGVMRWAEKVFRGSYIVQYRLGSLQK